MKTKRQILLVSGGMTFKSRKDYLHFLRTRKIFLERKISWSEKYLDRRLGRDFELIRPRMPLKDNAKYEDWKIHFERFLPYLRSGAILIGWSLGGVFLAKYLSEHKLRRKMAAVFLVGPPFDNSIPGEDLVGGFNLKADISLLEQNTRDLYLLFSADDEVVPVSHAEKYRKKLKTAAVIIYESKGGHFQVPEFPEIVEMIKSL